MLKKLAESNAARSGLVLVLAAVIVLAHISQVSSQQQGAGKTKVPQAKKASPDTSKGPSKRRYFLKPVSYTHLTLPTNREV